MRRLAIGPALLVPVILAGAVAALAEDLTADKLPAPVLATVRARFPDLKIVQAASEKNEKDELIYEVSLDNKGLNIDATFTPAGPMILMEKEITRAELPAPVAGALEKQFAKARYRIVEEVYEVTEAQETLAHYEVVLITPQKQIRGLEIAADGKILKVEKRTTEEED